VGPLSGGGTWLLKSDRGAGGGEKCLRVSRSKTDKMQSFSRGGGGGERKLGGEKGAPGRERSAPVLTGRTKGGEKTPRVVGKEPDQKGERLAGRLLLREEGMCPGKV